MKKYNQFIKESIDSTIDTTGTLIGKLFQSRDTTHIMHLMSKSYSEHVALGEYYSEIIGMIDRYSEAYIGLYDSIDITIPSSSKTDVKRYLSELHEFVSDFSKGVHDGELETILDEILELISTTIYKLKNLK